MSPTDDKPGTPAPGAATSSAPAASATPAAAPTPAASPATQMPAPARSGRRLLAAVLAGLLVAAALFACVMVALPSEGQADQKRLYDYVYSGVKSSSTDFTLANMSSDGYLVFGSSEFYISKGLVAQCPQAVFGENVTGVDMTFVGEAYDQSLWQAIAAGAYGDKVKNKKVAIVVSPQWFFKNNGSQSKFSSKFSYSLYRQFCENPNLSQQTKDYVRSRLGALGISQTQVAAANHDTPLDAINDVLYGLTDDLRMRTKIPHVIEQAPLKNGFKQKGTWTGEPNWDALLQQADKDGAAATTSNDLGIYDKFWEKNKNYAAERGQNFTEADDEYADLTCFIRVCVESGLEPLVIMLPMHGTWYDQMGVDQQTRDVYYQRIRDICVGQDVAYADFSSCEYEKYFLCDTVHPGWRGWVRIEESFYDFAHDWDDPFLGGGDGYGDAKGLGSA